jgi:hypothetical protein
VDVVISPGWKLAGYIAGGVLVLILALALLRGLGVKFDPFHLGDRQLASAQQAAATAKGEAAVANGQAEAQHQAATVADAGARRDSLTVTIHTDNEHAIQAAPGAAAGVDPDLNRVGRRGLCRYRAYADDPACAGLRGPDPAELPKADRWDPRAG